MSTPNEVVIDGVVFTRAEPRIVGTRCVVVCDRGWIFAGDVEDSDGRIRLTRAVHVRRWTGGIWFDGMLAAPDSDNVELAALGHVVDMPADAELFRIPVCEDWGL